MRTPRLATLIQITVFGLVGLCFGTGLLTLSFLRSTTTTVMAQAAIPPLPTHTTLQPTEVIVATNRNDVVERSRPHATADDALKVTPVRSLPTPTVVLPALSAIRIAKLDLARTIVPSTFNGTQGWSVPVHSVGHHDGSGQPADHTNIVLNGHVGGNDPVFHRLNELQPGDEIVLYRGDHAYTYAVSDTIRMQVVAAPSEQVAREAQGFLSPTDHEIVTLITCWPPRGPNAFDQRLIVRAVPLVQ